MRSFQIPLGSAFLSPNSSKSRWTPTPRTPPITIFLLAQSTNIDDEDGLVYEITRVVVRKGFIVAFRRLIVTFDGAQPREESTPIHVADVARMTAALHAPPIDDSVTRAPTTPSDAPDIRHQDTSLNPNQSAEAPLDVPSQSSSCHPGWNSQGRIIATYTLADKRRRISQGLELRTNLDSEFTTPPQQRRRRKHKSSISLLFLLYLHLSCLQSYNQALKFPESEAWRASMALEVDTLCSKRKCWQVVPYPTDGNHNYLRCHFVYKVKMKQGKVDRLKSRLVVDDSKQVHGLDCSESFTPIVKYTTLRIFLAISAAYNMHVH
jgi:hypothetical protein